MAPRSMTILKRSSANPESRSAYWNCVLLTFVPTCRSWRACMRSVISGTPLARALMRSITAYTDDLRTSNGFRSMSIRPTLIDGSPSIQ